MDVGALGLVDIEIGADDPQRLAVCVALVDQAAGQNPFEAAVGAQNALFPLIERSSPVGVRL